MQRYFFKDNSCLNEELNRVIINDKENVHHIKNVMRMKTGDKLIVCTNDCFEYLCQIDSITNCVDLKIIEKYENNNELKADITIAQGLVRREKKEEVIRRLVELGAYKYIPVEMERSIVHLNKYNENIDRINTIIKECSEQSERGKLMICNEAISFKKFLSELDYDYKFVCYEESGRSNEHSLKDYLFKLNSNNGVNKKILVLVGPEGGISNKELELLESNGFIKIGLGKRILRTETAPLYICSVLGYGVEFYED